MLGMDFLYPIKDRAQRYGYTIGLALCLICGNAVSLPLPYAATSSSLNLSISLNNVTLRPTKFTLIESASDTATAASAVAPVRSLSLHASNARNRVNIVAGEASKEGTTQGDINDISVSMENESEATALWRIPLGARANTNTRAGLYNAGVSVVPESAITLTWDFEQLYLETSPAASLAKIEHNVSISISTPDAPPGKSRTVSVGFSGTSRDGVTEWNAIDFPGSTSISDWLANLSESTNAPLSEPLKGPVVTIPLPYPNDTELELSVEVSHSESSIEAPLAAVRPVAELAGSEHSGGTSHWNAKNRQLSFDRLPLTKLLNAAGVPLSELESDRELDGAYFEIDPLVLVGDYNRGGYFAGTGDVRLLTEKGDVVLAASVPGLVYDLNLLHSEGFNMFGPLLEAYLQAYGESEWLQAFEQRLDSETFLLPELFVNLDIPSSELSRGDRWRKDFTAPAGVALSFAGPEVAISSPHTMALLLLGLALIAARKTRERRCSN